jgi:hypothetical protein
MAKSRAEVLESLRKIMGNGDTKPQPEAAPAKPAKNGEAAAAFAKFRRVDEVVAVADEEEVEEESEDESEDSDNDSEVESQSEDEATDVEVAPVEELLDRVEALIDYVSENSEALKAWIAACR